MKKHYKHKNKHEKQHNRFQHYGNNNNHKCFLSIKSSY